MNEKIIVTVGKDGSLQWDAQGFTGGKCKDAAAFLDQVAGGRAGHSDKPEMYETEGVESYEPQ